MQKIVIAGAGSVGCYVGATLAAAGRDTTLLLRPQRAEHVRQQGIRVTDLDSRNTLVGADRFTLATEPSTALAAADVVLVCVKSGDTASIAAGIAKHAPRQAIILSLQNGIGNEEVMAPLIAPRQALPGVVEFNTVLDEANAAKPLVVHRATSGGLYIPEGHAALQSLLAVEGLKVTAAVDMRGIAWGKLLLNLNNAINALSGLPLAQQLAQRDWRRILAAQTIEALTVLQAAGIKPEQIGAVRPQLVPHILSRCPDPRRWRRATFPCLVEYQFRVSVKNFIQILCVLCAFVV